MNQVLPELELITPEVNEQDRQIGFAPSSFDQYLGQHVVKEKLQVYTKAAIQRGEPLDHLLLFGPPGLGKTTMATIIAKELNADIKITSAPVLDRR